MGRSRRAPLPAQPQPQRSSALGQLPISAKRSPRVEALLGSDIFQVRSCRRGIAAKPAADYGCNTSLLTHSQGAAQLGQ